MAEGAFNVEAFKETFEKAGFNVKEIDKGKDGMFRLEYNYPDEKSAGALRAAFAKHGGEMATYYRYLDRPHSRGELGSRERVLVPYASDADLRQFFNDAFNTFNIFMDEGSVGIAAGGRDSSYQVETKKRRALYA